MKKIVCILFLFSIFYFLITLPVYADYVLPYPSYMPGNKMYQVMRITDKVKRYWFWGNIAQVKYHLGLSDKYLVEAKTLLEYNQYLLASDALVRSDNEFMQLSEYIQRAKSRGIDISNLEKTVSEAGRKHSDVLIQLLIVVPQEFTWAPEKAQATQLQLKLMLENSIHIRNKVVDEISEY